MKHKAAASFTKKKKLPVVGLDQIKAVHHMLWRKAYWLIWVGRGRVKKKHVVQKLVGQAREWGEGGMGGFPVLCFLYRLAVSETKMYWH